VAPSRDDRIRTEAFAEDESGSRRGLVQKALNRQDGGFPVDNDDIGRDPRDFSNGLIEACGRYGIVAGAMEFLDDELPHLVICSKNQDPAERRHGTR